MAHREFIDSDGSYWQAWEVIPSMAERRSSGERRLTVRDRHDRRVQHQVRATLEDGLSLGWLVFESATEKRRLHPIPQGWSNLSDAELTMLALSADATLRPLPTRTDTESLKPEDEQ